MGERQRAHSTALVKVALAGQLPVQGGAGLEADIAANELVVPVGRPVVIQVTSKDVIHGLAIVPMFSQQDAIPGSEIPLWFVPEKEGEWNIVCAQLCGAGHAKMVSYVKAVSSEEFDKWYASQNPLLPKK